MKKVLLGTVLGVCISLAPGVVLADGDMDEGATAAENSAGASAADEATSEAKGVAARSNVGGEGWKDLPKKERVAREWRSLTRAQRVERERLGKRPSILDN